MKSAGLAYILLFVSGFTCICGLHRFYLNRPLTGILWLCTFGLFGIGQIIDLFLIPSMVDEENGDSPRRQGHQTVIVNVHSGGRARKKSKGPQNDFDFD